jgi:asparagine synthase (glutamine-hydrolysing)
MCGISGIIKKNNEKLTLDEFHGFKSCVELMNHRGPDNFQSHYDGQIALFHQRLSIIDLDPRANQPFVSKSGNLICVFNGEVYNYLDLKKRLNIETLTNSDTEVIVESYELVGENIVDQWNGIFALCIYDKFKKQITLIRDRFGVKPLYVFENAEFFIFVSEAKVIYAWLNNLKLNYQALSEYIFQGSTISSCTFVNDVHKFDSGVILNYSLISNCKTSKPFWDFPGTKSAKYRIKEVIAETKYLIETAVSRQLNSDVPIGVFLSGGLDSSCIAAVAATKSNDQINTFTAEFDFNPNSKYELSNAKILANKYNTRHQEVKVEVDGLSSIIEKLCFQHDDPFADPANIPLYLLSKELKNNVKVVLQGDGADELFGGYSRYGIMKNQNLISKTLKIFDMFPMNEILKSKVSRINSNLKLKSEFSKIAMMSFTYENYLNPWCIFSENFKENLMLVNPFNEHKKLNTLFANEDILQRMIYMDFNIELKNTYFEKVDKSTMLNGVEARVPFIDNDLCQYVLSLPSDLKINSINRKQILKLALKEYLPTEIIKSPKRGFGVPISNWLRGGLKCFLKDMLLLGIDKGILSEYEVKDLLNNHLSGKKDNGIILWKLLILMIWINKYENKIVF